MLSIVTRIASLKDHYRRKAVALQNIKATDKLNTDAYSRWFKSGINPKDAHGLYACQRLRNTYLVPFVQPSFKIRRDDKLFAMGSCFARGIEATLLRSGFDVVSAARDFDKFAMTENQGTPLGFTNKYTTFSMLNEITWALEPGAKFPEESLVDIDAGLCIDPHINPALQAVDRAGTLGRRQIITEVPRRIKACRVLFMTLGLVEVWYDSLAKVFLNTTPIKQMRELHPGRYKFSVTDYVANLDNLEKIYTVLKQFGHPDLRVIVTVSPVPLMATYSKQDVVIANTYSKSTLRAVAQDWAARHDNVQYFPSYEIVMNSKHSAAWEDDLRHVQGKAVRHVMDLFVKNFVE